MALDSNLNQPQLTSALFGERDVLSPAEDAYWRSGEAYPGLFAMQGAPSDTGNYTYFDRYFSLAGSENRLFTATARRAGYAVTFGTLHREAGNDSDFKGPQHVNVLRSTVGRLNTSLNDQNIDLGLSIEKGYGIRLLGDDSEASDAIADDGHPKTVLSRVPNTENLVVDGLSLVRSDGRRVRLSMLEHLAVTAIFELGLDMDVYTDDIMEKAVTQNGLTNYYENPAADVRRVTASNTSDLLNEVGYGIVAQAGDGAGGGPTRRIIQVS